MTCLRSFASSWPSIFRKELIDVLDYETAENYRLKYFMDHIIPLAKLMVFRFVDVVAILKTDTSWTDEKLSHINIFLMEYIAEENM